MKKPYLQVRNEDNTILWVMLYDDPDAGPGIPVPTAQPGFTLIDAPEASTFTRAGRRATEVAFWRDGVIEWEDSVPLAAHIKAAIDATYPDVDAIYEAAVGRRTTEYTRAEEAAREYVAAEVKPAIVSSYITGHAERNPTGEVQTNEWAAQQIIERADAFRWAELQMRNARFAHQADMRAATSAEELEAVVESWRGFIEWLREILGV